MLQYSYEPLQSAEPSSRFLSLQPGHTDDPVEIVLWEQQLESIENEYEALSYCWGKPTPRKDILIDNWEFSVTENLHSALRRLRLVDQKRVLWIDAVCIDQSNNDEKSAQIMHMGQIYRMAKQVVVWLGEDQMVISSPNDRRLYGAPVEVCSMADRMDDLIFQTMSEEGEPVPRLRGPDPMAMFQEFRRTGGLLEMYQTLIKVHKNPYWTRIWIIQELAFAKELIIQCGKYTWSWESFGKSSEWLRKAAAPWSDFMHFEEFTGKMDRVRSLRLSSTKLDLLQLLREFRDSNATDYRDKVYGLLGLSDCALRVDYNLGQHEVYFDVVEALINNHASLNFLADCRYQNSNDSQLPSWFPDWSRRNTSGSADSAVNDPCFHASRERKAELKDSLQAPWDQYPNFIPDRPLVVRSIGLTTFTERPSIDVHMPFTFSLSAEETFLVTENNTSLSDLRWNPAMNRTCIICIVFGCDVPIAMEAVERNGYLAWQLLGGIKSAPELKGYTEGQAIEELREGLWKEDWFTLI